MAGVGDKSQTLPGQCLICSRELCSEEESFPGNALVSIIVCFTVEIPVDSHNRKHSICENCSRRLSLTHRFKSKIMDTLSKFIFTPTEGNPSASSPALENDPIFNTNHDKEKSNACQSETKIVFKSVEGENDVNNGVLKENSQTECRKSDAGLENDINDRFEYENSLVHVKTEKEATADCTVQSELNRKERSEPVKYETHTYKDVLVGLIKIEHLYEEIKCAPPEKSVIRINRKKLASAQKIERRHFDGHRFVFNRSNTTKEEADSNFNCRECNKVFKSKKNLIAHLRRHEKKPKTPKNEMLDFKCILCPRAFSSEMTLTAHMNCHTDKTNYKCNECFRSFKSYTTLYEHLRQHGLEGKYECKICHKKFMTNCYLNKHMGSHNDKYFSCDVCLKTFKYKRCLDEHILAHKGVLSLKCTLCLRPFINKSNLRRHMATHDIMNVMKRVKNDETLWPREVPCEYVRPRMHECAVCNKAFGSANDLRKHTIVHSDTRSFECTECPKSFKHKQSLMQHVAQMHEGIDDYKCCICNRTFVNKHALARHIKNGTHGQPGEPSV